MKWTLGATLALLSAAALAQGVSQNIGLPDDLLEYLSWERANPEKWLEPSAHPVAKDIYFNESAAESLAGGTFPHAEGSAFVKETTDPETLSVTVISAMRKVAGFNPEGSDWQYGMFERSEDGSFTGDWMSVSDAAMCAECHSAAAETDYTFLTYFGAGESE